MKHFIPRKILYRKITDIFVILIILSIGLYFFNVNQEFLDNFKFYYLKSHTRTFTNNVVEVNKFNKTASIPILLYHGIINKSDGFNVLTDDFADQMFALKENGWQTITLKDYYKFIQGKKELAEKSFLLTFDDGQKDSYYPVDPILKKLDYNAVIFIIAEKMEKNNESNFYLTKNELLQMKESKRWEIQPHTFAGHGFVEIDADKNKEHFYSNKKWLNNLSGLETNEEYKERIKNDIVLAKKIVLNEFEDDIIGFAFPFGDFGQESINYKESKNILLDQIRQIYPLAFYQVWAGSDYTFNYPKSDNFLVKRINVKPEWTADDLLTVLEKGGDKSLPYSDNFNSDKGWLKNWGGMEINNNELILSSASTTGAGAFLDGTYLWKNYSFNAKVDFKKGKTFSLVALYYDKDNYISCNYNEDGIIIREKISGKEDRVVGWKTNSLHLKGENIHVGISAFGNNAKCFINGRLAVNTDFIDAKLTNGGIGFKVWDPEINNSELIIKEISVEEIK